MGLVSVRIVPSQKASQLSESIGTVEIIRIDDRKRTVYRICGAKHRMRRPPGLDPAIRDTDALGKRIDILKYIFRFYLSGDPVPDSFPERLIVLPLYDENYLVKSGS